VSTSTDRSIAERADQEIEPGLAAPEPGPRVTAPLGRRKCAIASNRAIGVYRLLAAEDPSGPAPLAGQFYMLAAAEGWGEGSSQRPYLARAFSVCRAGENVLEFLVDAIGPGTARLAALEPGGGLWVVGPLGVGFSEPVELSGGAEATAILVGGGIGVAPLVIWERRLRERGIAAKVLLGFRSQHYCAAAELFSDPAAIATDDGSAGRRALVTDLLETELGGRSDAVVYACGPPAMLEATRGICARHDVPAQLALEETMACGFGACFGCAIRTRTGYRRLCVDGPVVSAADLDEGWLRE
jgi:dihydroorotate dehydrogenase electron transfer subunit